SATPVDEAVEVGVIVRVGVAVDVAVAVRVVVAVDVGDLVEVGVMVRVGVTVRVAVAAGVEFGGLPPPPILNVVRWLTEAKTVWLSVSTPVVRSCHVVPPSLLEEITSPVASMPFAASS